jgi:hypothetical protein
MHWYKELFDVKVQIKFGNVSKKYKLCDKEIAVKLNSEST